MTRKKYSKYNNPHFNHIGIINSQPIIFNTMVRIWKTFAQTFLIWQRKLHYLSTLDNFYILLGNRFLLKNVSPGTCNSFVYYLLKLFFGDFHKNGNAAIESFQRLDPFVSFVLIM